LVFDKLITASKRMQRILEDNSVSNSQHPFDWPAITYKNPGVYRRADLDIIDARLDRKLWMMHLCIYPKVSDPSPIYGFDIIAGPNKVTGAFHDFSPVAFDNPILTQFKENVKPFIPSKRRELPEWARNIFSDSMVSAGNVRDGQELDDILELAITNLEYYLTAIGEESDKDYTTQHNWYCENQKKNPHTPRVMETLGVDPKRVREYIDECLVPEIVN